MISKEFDPAVNLAKDRTDELGLGIAKLGIFALVHYDNSSRTRAVAQFGKKVIRSSYEILTVVALKFVDQLRFDSLWVNR